MDTKDTNGDLPQVIVDDGDGDFIDVEKPKFTKKRSNSLYSR